MSVSLNLVIYQCKDENLIETDVRTIQCEELSPVLLDLLTESFPLNEIPVYFDETLEDSFEIECFNNSDVKDILDMLKKNFLELLEHEYKGLTAGEDSSLKVQPVDGELDNNLNSPLDIAIARFHILTGVIKLFEKKYSKLSDDFTAVIKLG